MTTTNDDVTALFLQFSRQRLFDQFFPRLRTCIEKLTPEQLSWRPNEASNSIANLVLHLNGNVRQWLVGSFNHEPDHRDRPAEFSERGPISASALLDLLGATMEQAAAVLSRLTTADLVAFYDIQGFRVRGLDAVYQVVDHFGLHYGQILYITKALTATDLGFYRDLSATGRASASNKTGI